MGQELKGFKIKECYLKDVGEKLPPILGVTFKNSEGQEYRLEGFEKTTKGEDNKKIKNAFINMGIDKINRSTLFMMADKNISIFKDIEYNIETTVNEQGYEEVLYVNDPEKPHATFSTMTREALAKKLGLDTNDTAKMQGSDDLPI